MSLSDLLHECIEYGELYPCADDDVVMAKKWGQQVFNQSCMRN